MRYRKILVTLAIIPVLTLSACLDDKPEEKQAFDPSGMFGASMSSRGEYVATTSVDKFTQLRDIKTNSIMHSYTLQKGEPTHFHIVELSKNGDFAVTILNNVLVLWDTMAGKDLKYWEFPSKINYAKITNDGKYVALVFDYKTVSLIDLEHGHSVFTVIHGDKINAIDMSFDARYIVSATENKQVTVWDIFTNKKLHVIDTKTNVRHIKLSNSGNKFMTSASFMPINIYETKSGEIIQSMTRYPKAMMWFSHPAIHVTASNFSQDDRYLVVGAPPRNLYLFDTKNGKCKNAWIIPRESEWKPTSIAILATAVNFDKNEIYAQATNGYNYIYKIDNKIDNARNN